MPKTANQKIYDAYIRHQTDLLRYTTGLTTRLVPILAGTEETLYNTINKWISKVEGQRTLTGDKGRKWQKNFQKALSAVRQPAWGDIDEETFEQMKALAVLEAKIGAKTIEAALPVVIGMSLPPTAKLISIVNSQPFEGRTLREWMNRTAQADVQRMSAYAKAGIVQGQTPTEIARGIIGTKRAKYKDGQARKAFRDLESVILTVTNGIQHESKQALYAANSDIVDRELFVNTLDVRTTLECIAAGEADKYGMGKGVYPIGKGPMPPLHFRCRSLRVAYINPDNLGNRPFDSSTEKQLLREYTKEAGLSRVIKRDDLPYGYKTKFDEFARKRRRELVGQVPAKTSYGEFLKTQSKEFQDEKLGPTRAEMFRKGEIAVDKFVSDSGRVLTLDDLERRGYAIN